ncbi:MAG: hypothetical protein AAB875_06450, partial [Patescibacteria group bacterium]
MLTKFSPEQEALIPVVRNEWLEHIFSLPQMNNAKTKELVSFLYDLNKNFLPIIILLDSPLAC